MRVFAAALLLLVPPLAWGAPHGIALTPAQMKDGGVAVARPAPMRFTPARRGYGMVVDASPALALRAAIVQAEARERLTMATLARTRTLFRGAGNVSEAALQQAEAAQAVASARLAGLKVKARTKYGAALGGAMISGGKAVRALAAGESLVEVDLPGAALADPPGVAKAGAAKLTLIGVSGHLPRGMVGEGLYYRGPAMQVGTPLAVSLPTGAVLSGVLVPASSVLYQGGGAKVFVETAAGHFVPVAISIGAKIRGHGAVAGYFVANGVLSAGAKVVVAGAGLLRSIARTTHSKTTKG